MQESYVIHDMGEAVSSYMGWGYARAPTTLTSAKGRTFGTPEHQTRMKRNSIRAQQSQRPQLSE